jgi:hypothetical protein
MQGRYKSKLRAVIGAIMAGAYPKEAALAHGANRSYGCKAARAGGLTPRYVTEREWRAILDQRKNSHGMA